MDTESAGAPPAGGIRSWDALLADTAAAEAECHTAGLWPTVRTEPLGRWTLRIDTREHAPPLKRANSCLAMDEPGLDVETALLGVIAFYESAAAQPRVQVRAGSAVEHAVSAAGWTPVAGDSHFMTATLDDVRDLLPHPDGEVDVVAHRSHIAATLAAGGAPAARGAARADGAWLGVHGLFVEPVLRRQGLAHRVLAGILSHEAARACAVGWLHVETDNDPAIALYQKLGFRLHHSCRYYEPAGGPGRGGVRR